MARPKRNFKPRPRLDADGNVIDPRTKMLEEWTPKTELGRKVKSGEITTIEEVLRVISE